MAAPTSLARVARRLEQCVATVQHCMECCVRLAKPTLATELSHARTNALMTYTSMAYTFMAYTFMAYTFMA